jgi:anti-sigma regulatory factor (Ser/Thr protein kinase)
MSTVERTLRLHATVASVRAARHALDDVPELRHLPRLRFDAGLLVTELVSNSVRHSGMSTADQITVAVCFEEGRLRVEVTDTGPGFDPPNLVEPPLGSSGRGLFLVEALADDWAVEQTPAGTVVWFQMAADGRRA